MSDNLKTDKHVYLVSVFTGLSRNSGTTSNVSFVIASLLKDTGVRHLTDGVKKVPLVTSSLQPILKSLQYIQIEQGFLFCARLHVYFLAGFYLQYTCIFFFTLRRVSRQEVSSLTSWPFRIPLVTWLFWTSGTTTAGREGTPRGI